VTAAGDRDLAPGAKRADGATTMATTPVRPMGWRSSTIRQPAASDVVDGARTTGCSGANPFGQHDYERLRIKHAGDYSISRWRSLTLRYRFYFHFGDEARQGGAQYADYSAGIEDRADEPAPWRLGAPAPVARFAPAPRAVARAPRLISFHRNRSVSTQLRAAGPREPGNLKYPTVNFRMVQGRTPPFQRAPGRVRSRPSRSQTIGPQVYGAHNLPRISGLQDSAGVQAARPNGCLATFAQLIPFRHRARHQARARIFTAHGRIRPPLGVAGAADLRARFGG